MKKLTNLIFILISSIIYSASPILSAIDNCSKVIKEADKTICNNPKLSKLDRQISIIYKKLNKKGKYYEEIVKNQSTWILKTNDFR
tara:strand:- start:417 stop:674 length:258 start_codon:yes stop_codon:yes gene_type:complete